jgi:hypothetical protein
MYYTRVRSPRPLMAGVRQQRENMSFRKPVFILLLMVICFLFKDINLLCQHTNPCQIVRAYCQLDFDGAQLNAAKWINLLSPSARYEFTEWSGFVVAKEYAVISCDVNEDKAIVVVKYEIYCLPNGKPWYPKRDQTVPKEIILLPESVNYSLVKLNDNWFIMAAMRPHVSFAVAKKFMTSVR